MADYYTRLAQTIRETSEDPAKLRDAVYESARLALRRHLNTQPISIAETKRHMSDLEDAIARLEAQATRSNAQSDRDLAIARLEAEATRPTARPDRDSGIVRPKLEATRPNALPDRDSTIPGSPKAVQQSHRVPVEDVAETDVELHAGTWDALRTQPAERDGSRDLVLVSDRTVAARRPYLVNPDDFVNPDVTYRVPPEPRGPGRALLSGLKVAFQLAIAALAVAAFYIAMWGRSGPVRTVQEVPPAAAQRTSRSPTAAQDAPAVGTTTAAVQLPAVTAPGAAVPVVVALPFPRPSAYGVYAVRDNELIALQPVQTAPVDPRTRNQLQIVDPGRTVIADAKLAFVVFRRDLAAHAPEKVSVHVAARIAHSMNFDSAGMAVVTTPATDTWLIRDQGYDLRVTPIRESPEMVMLNPENPALAFPSGRYELMFGGQAYDFIVAGEVIDSAHCVEGVATVRGPEFYECKSL
jgi:hypothetical protein